MKKGLIVEHRRRYTIVLAKNGVFYKAKPLHDKQIGEDVLFEEMMKKKSFIRFPKIAMIPVIVLVILMISPLYLWLANDKVYAVISIDINPSLNVMVDKDYRVLEIRANNEDGQQVLQDLELKEKTLEEITTNILQYVKTNFAIEEDAPVLVAVSYTDVENASDTVVNEMNDQIEELGFQGTVYQAAEDWRIQSEEQEVSMNMIAHEILAEISETKEEDVKVGEMNQALITQFFNNKKNSSKPDESKKNSNPDTVEDSISKEQKKPESKDKEGPKLPPQANERAKEQVENKGPSNKDKNKEGRQSSDNKKSPGLEQKDSKGKKGPPELPVEAQPGPGLSPHENDEDETDEVGKQGEIEQNGKNGLDD